MSPRRHAQLPLTFAVLQEGIGSGLHAGGQIYVSLEGRALCSEGFGEDPARGPVREDQVMLWMSAGKPLTAVAVALLVQSGALDIERKVSDYLPAFASGGKGWVRVRDVLCHMGGFRAADLKLKTGTWDESIRIICETPLEPRWTPGVKAGYHVASGWYLLGELIRLVDGRPVESFLQESVFTPLGMLDCTLGPSPSPPLPVWLTDGDSPELHPELNRQAFLDLVSPGRSAKGPARALGRFYEALLYPDTVEGPWLTVETIRRFTGRERVGLMDATFRHVMDWGLGFIPDNKRYGAGTVPYGYGARASSETFGHGGARSSVGFADPAHGLAAVLIFNGMPTEEQHQARIRSACEALYLDLNLTGS